MTHTKINPSCATDCRPLHFALCIHRRSHTLHIHRVSPNDQYAARIFFSPTYIFPSTFLLHETHIAYHYYTSHPGTYPVYKYLNLSRLDLLFDLSASLLYGSLQFLFVLPHRGFHT